MLMGWTGLVRVIAVTVMVTSVAWVAAGAWWLQSSSHWARETRAVAAAAQGRGGSVPVTEARPPIALQSPVAARPEARKYGRLSPWHTVIDVRL